MQHGQKGEDWRFSRFQPFPLICGMSKYGAGAAGGRKGLRYGRLWGGVAGAAASVPRSPATATSGAPNPDEP